jgi:Phenol hydroxylase, C-terminal dimerisation domain
MQIATIGLDIAKNVFQVHGIDAREKAVVRKKLRHLAKGLVIGKRFHSARVILADAKPVYLGHTIKVHGRWRLFAFSGAEDPSAASLRHQFTLRFSCPVTRVSR